jgi:flagellar motility protein MotE (MotC chaperone)
VKQLWTLFVTGLFAVAVSWAVLSDTRASQTDPRIKKIDDPSISGLKTPAPSQSDLETALVAREKELDGREARVKEAEDRLKVEETRLKLQVQEMEKLQSDLEAMEDKNKAKNQEILKKLVKTYETMSPKKAAGVLSVMKDSEAVEIFMNMKEKKLAAILDAMDPNRAMTLSTAMAKRRPAGEAVGEEQPQQSKGAPN